MGGRKLLELGCPFSHMEIVLSLYVDMTEALWKTI